MTSKTDAKKIKPKQKRGFACIDPAVRVTYFRRGGKTTAEKHGTAHMSKIGRIGRLKRAKMERKAKRLA